MLCFHEGRGRQHCCPSNKIYKTRSYNNRIFSKIWQRVMLKKWFNYFMHVQYTFICVCCSLFSLGSTDFWCILFSFLWKYQIGFLPTDEGKPSGSDMLKWFSETTFLWTNKCHTHICSFVICCSHVLCPESMHPSSFFILWLSICFFLYIFCIIVAYPFFKYYYAVLPEVR